MGIIHKGFVCDRELVTANYVPNVKATQCRARLTVRDSIDGAAVFKCDVRLNEIGGLLQFAYTTRIDTWIRNILNEVLDELFEDDKGVALSKLWKLFRRRVVNYFAQLNDNMATINSSRYCSISITEPQLMLVIGTGFNDSICVELSDELSNDMTVFKQIINIAKELDDVMESLSADDRIDAIMTRLTALEH